MFLAKCAFELRAGKPPSSGAEIITWAHAHEFSIAMVSETLFFADGFLVLGAAALYMSLVGVDRTKATLGVGLVGVVIPLLAAILVVHGRLAFPMYGMELHDPATAELLVTVFYGGWHAALLLLAGGTLLVSLAMRRTGYGPVGLWLGLLATLGDLVGSYPDRIGGVGLLATSLLLASWFVVVGWQMWRNATEWS